MSKISIICDNPKRRPVFEEVYHYSEYGFTCDYILHVTKQLNICGDQYNLNFTLLDDKLKDLVFEYTLENVAVLKIFLKNSFYPRIESNVAFTYTQMVAFTGGILSLGCGLSFVSIVELLYHITDYILDKISLFIQAQ